MKSYTHTHTHARTHAHEHPIGWDVHGRLNMWSVLIKQAVTWRLQTNNHSLKGPEKILP